jgi:protein TonB
MQSAAPKRIRVGGNVQATKILRMTRPQYPQHLQQQGIEGTVLLEGVISLDGSLLSLRSQNALVHPELTKAAIDAVQQWKYQPTLLNGQPVEIITTIQVNFRLAE